MCKLGEKDTNSKNCYAASLGLYWESVYPASLGLYWETVYPASIGLYWESNNSRILKIARQDYQQAETTQTKEADKDLLGCTNGSGLCNTNSPNIRRANVDCHVRNLKLEVVLNHH